MAGNPYLQDPEKPIANKKLTETEMPLPGEWIVCKVIPKNKLYQDSKRDEVIGWALVVFMIILMLLIISIPISVILQS